MNSQNELLKQQLIEAISCQNLQEIQKILSLAQLEDETIILKEALVQVEYANFVWFLQEYVGKESYQQAVKDVSTSMTQKLVQGGFKPGVDFNLHPDGRMLASKEANEYLEKYHSKQLENSQISVVAHALPEPMQMLEKALGVRFFENLGRVAATRLATMDDATASIYGLWLMQGISARHPLLEKDFCEWFMIEICGERLSVLASAEIQGLEFNGLVVFEDLLMALGKTNVSIVKENDLTLENLRLLDQVWTGENMRVFELISILEKDGERNF
ncbi:hypothetical protein A4S05_00790 [Nostoc sp. KVJ20]|uniref:hypothetical protein n=1 Tax=Nostoc sp. KVJ20 TaxID=457944 RepID=UPI00083DFC47|nr:hypothetical protein [Nostoc sp. KVJ20]ODG97984.1 hypothetical protein A4S05_00790 [Nostoc sp. KVJ20]